MQVLAYELRVALLEQARTVGANGRPKAGTLAQSDEIERMYVHLENALIALDFLDPRNPKKLMPRLRRLFAHGPRTRGGQHPARRREASC